jgi:hypothetical protein
MIICMEYALNHKYSLCWLTYDAVIQPNSNQGSSKSAKGV